jgi:hypothetical protein
MSNRSAVGRILRIASTILLLSQSLGTADATLRPMQSLESRFAAAGMVAVLRVDDIQPVYVENDRCGFRYTATILKLFKGTGSAYEQVQFGRFLGLELDKTYLALLDDDNDPEAIYRSMRDENHLPDVKDEAEKKQVMSKVMCNGLVPGLGFNEWYTWPIVVNYVIVTGLLPADMPGDVRVYPTDSSQWWLQKQDLFSYLDALGQRH